MVDHSTSLPRTPLNEAIEIAEKHMAAENLPMDCRSLVNAVPVETGGGGWLLIWMTTEQIELYRTPGLRGGGALRVTVSSEQDVEFVFER